MTEEEEQQEEQEDENKRIRPRERARGQKNIHQNKYSVTAIIYCCYRLF